MRAISCGTTRSQVPSPMVPRHLLIFSCTLSSSPYRNHRPMRLSVSWMTVATSWSVPREMDLKNPRTDSVT